MTPFDPIVYEDPKIKTTLAMLAQGKSKQEITEHFGHKGWFTIDQYFRRRGFRWNGNTFVPDEAETTSAVDDARFLNSKAGQIIRQLSQSSANIRQVALKNGFATVDEMGDYMRGQGFVWDSEQENYTYSESLAKKQRDTQTAASQAFSKTPEDLEDYKELLAYLLSRKDKLFALLETENEGTLPRYKFRGSKANKTLAFPTSVLTLLSDFSKEFNVTQREIIEVALAEFFRKYGYEEQLNSVLQA
ncbi:hypothetical protein [Brevibacillus aydinogluensis]|jgi:hypothetical protein|uniref:RHH-3 domain-containing protein n=1 Tax=Brevibacillus aydinogluensis TaxID=927786 RepID=A0AA48RGE9_9BACL|nr:hypothetical protein [Brevibacillus aydinogluensis]CAJ1001069.1 RHH-3 domain-containing protein [Brevibacillus aydinogluensis]